MSLLLRKECQNLLTSHGLGNYHAAIGRHIRYLEIVGSCGKPFATIYGVLFSRNIPTKAEIEYAVTLLEDFLLAHKTTVQNFLKAAQALANTPDTKETPDMVIPYISIINGTYYENELYIQYKDGPFTVVVYPTYVKTVLLNDNYHKENVLNNPPVLLVTHAYIEAFTFDKKLLATAKKLIVIKRKHVEALVLVYKCKDELSACKI